MILYIYAKDGRIKALNNQEKTIEAPKLIITGYKHTATIDAAVFIEYLVQYTDEEIVKQIRNLSRT